MDNALIIFILCILYIIEVILHMRTKNKLKKLEERFSLDSEDI